MRKIDEFYNESPTKTKTRQKILASAKELFFEFGIEGVVMMQVSERAGITARNLYRYYSSKELLVIDVAYLVLTTDYKINDIELNQNMTGLELFEDLLYGLFTDRSSVFYDISLMKFLMEFDIFVLNIDKANIIYKKYQEEQAFSMDYKIKQYLSDVLIKGLKDGSVDIPIRQLDFYIDFIIQSLISIIMRVTIKQESNEKFNHAFVEKQIEILLKHLSSSK
jgi:AcrR family transcriptional regulator